MIDTDSPYRHRDLLMKEGIICNKSQIVVNMAMCRLKFVNITIAVVCLCMLTGCTPPGGKEAVTFPPTKTPFFLIATQPTNIDATSTVIPNRKRYSPGELVDYNVQSGDTVDALAAHFNTKVEEIREVNPILPAETTTLPVGLPLKIPIYYQSLWGNPFQILPDSLFINGPEQVDFDVVEYVDSQPGWLKAYIDYPSGNRMRGGEIIQHVAINFSLSPRLLLAIIEYQTGGLTQPVIPDENQDYPLGFMDKDHKGLAKQLVLAANLLNNGYYGWRTGRLTSFDHNDGRVEYPDPWQNAASVAIQYYFSQVLSRQAYEKATQDQGLLKTYQALFENPWLKVEPHIPGSLQQPEMVMPFEIDKTWNYTGGPHTGWGTGDPWAAIDFAPLGVTGCNPSNSWATAVANGVIVRSDTGLAVLDLDGDGDERTGWTVFYLHLRTDSRVQVGQHLNTRDPVGYPSCEGGTSTGTHIHIARKYNGEWIPAGGALAFTLEGWQASNGNAAYDGKLNRFGKVVTASSISAAGSEIRSENR